MLHNVDGIVTDDPEVPRLRHMAAKLRRAVRKGELLPGVALRALHAYADSLREAKPRHA